MTWQSPHPTPAPPRWGQLHTADAVHTDITEAFACGTAAVITPIGELKGEGFSIGDANAPAGDVTMAIRQELTDIQYGRIPDRHDWLVKLR